jgi:hypothetical protein
MTPFPFETSARIDWSASKPVFGERVETDEDLQLVELLVTVTVNDREGSRSSLACAGPLRESSRLGERRPAWPWLL